MSRQERRIVETIRQAVESGEPARLSPSDYLLLRRILRVHSARSDAGYLGGALGVFSGVQLVLTRPLIEPRPRKRKRGRR